MKEKGQILVETMIALGMVVVGLLGLISLLSYSIGLSRFVSQQYTASYLAAEGIEVIKNIADNNSYQGFNFTSGLDTCQTGCEVQYDDYSVRPRSGGNRLNFDENSKYSYEGGVPTPFIRTIYITLNGDEMMVRSNVQWRYKNETSLRSVDVEDHFYNWRQPINP